MASETRQLAISVPAGTSEAAPLVANLELYGRTVRDLAVRFPAGCSGLVGAALVSSGVHVAPLDGWFTGDDESVTWSVDRDVRRDDWWLRAYNLGIYPHTLLVTVGVDRLVRQSVRPAR